MKTVFCCLKLPPLGGSQRRHLNIWLHSSPRTLRGSSTSDYSCAASQNTKINKQSQRFWGPFVWLNKCLNPLLWLHFALTSSSCASFADQLENGVPLLSRHMPSIRCCSTHTHSHTQTHTHPKPKHKVNCYFNPWNEILFKSTHLNGSLEATLSTPFRLFYVSCSYVG